MLGTCQECERWDGPIKVFHGVLSLLSVQLKKVEMKNIFSETSQFFLLFFFYLI